MGDGQAGSRTSVRVPVVLLSRRHGFAFQFRALVGAVVEPLDLQAVTRPIDPHRRASARRAFIKSRDLDEHSGEFRAAYQAYQLEATYLTLTSNVVAATVQGASLRGQIAATEEIVKIESASRDILRKQFQLGQVAGLDVAAVEAALAQAQATLPPLLKQLAVHAIC